MIVPMKKATLLVIPKEQRQAVKKLRGLGVMHVHPVQQPQSDDLEDLKGKLARAEKAMIVLGETEPNSKPSKISGEKTVDQILQLSEEQATLASKLEEAEKTREWFNLWGEVTLESIQELEEAGITLRCYKLDKSALKTLPEDLNVQILGEAQGVIHAVLFAQSKEEKLDFKEEIMPKVQVSELDETIQSHQKRLSEIHKEIQKSVNQKPVILDHITSLQKDLDYHTVLAGIGSIEDLVYLQGFVPEDTVPSLEKLAEVEGWGMILEDPEDPAEVPTLLKNPPWIRIIQPLFDFMGTVPGYHEKDISVWFLIFLSLFFAMLIGDAGYGLLFIGLTFFAERKAGKVVPKEPFRLLYLMSFITVVWGVLTGTWFGYEKIADLPLFRAGVIEQIDSFAEDNSQFMMYICFVIGIVHLTIARLINAYKIKHSLRALGEVGWIGILWSVFFLVQSLVVGKTLPALTLPLLIGGILLALVFSNWQKNVIKGIGETSFDLPLSVISSFSDIMSYLRLFAVGFAAVQVASAFNEIAIGSGIDSVLKGFLAAIVLFFGHSLNIVLGLMAVLVHGVRLNMLEFSGHLNQQWSGKPYQPFRQ